MSDNLMDMFAAHALAGILAGGHCDLEEAAATAFRLADEMMVERIRGYLEPDAAPEAHQPQQENDTSHMPAVPIEDLPEWANFAAKDRDGEVFVYESMPQDGETFWRLGGKGELIKKGPACPDWRNSLIYLRPLREAMLAKRGAEVPPQLGDGWISDDIFLDVPEDRVVKLNMSTPYPGGLTEADRLLALNRELLNALKLAVTSGFIPEVPPLPNGVTAPAKILAAKIIRNTIGEADGLL